MLQADHETVRSLKYFHNVLSRHDIFLIFIADIWERKAMNEDVTQRTVQRRLRAQGFVPVRVWFPAHWAARLERMSAALVSCALENKEVNQDSDV
jgi:hypothetical protein